MRQLFFNLTPSVVAALSCSAHGGDIKQAPDGVIRLQPHRKVVLTKPIPLNAPSSMGFDFPGRVNIKRPLGSFQYRYGRKVNPPDEWFDAKYKINAYD
jgi:hypothetical protein